MFNAEYREWKIEYNEEKEVFEATKDENAIEDKSLKNLKKRIVKYKFIREQVYFSDYNGIHYGEVTTKFDDGRYRVSYTQGEDENKYDTWTKISTRNMYTSNEKNKKIVEQVQNRGEQIKNLESEIELLKKNLTPYSTETSNL